MYILDKDSNQLINAEQTTFKEQKLNAHGDSPPGHIIS